MAAFEAVFQNAPRIELDHHILYHARTFTSLCFQRFLLISATQITSLDDCWHVRATRKEPVNILSSSSQVCSSLYVSSFTSKLEYSGKPLEVSPASRKVSISFYRLPSTVYLSPYIPSFFSGKVQHGECPSHADTCFHRSVTLENPPIYILYMY